MWQQPMGLGPLQEYWLDAWQRFLLFPDVLCERGSQYLEYNASKVPHVLAFGAELVRDGRTLERQVNYVLVRIVQPSEFKIDPAKLPFMVVDPRVAHGPGIGGPKQDKGAWYGSRSGPSMLNPWLSSGVRARTNDRGDVPG